MVDGVVCHRLRRTNRPFDSAIQVMLAAGVLAGAGRTDLCPAILLSITALLLDINSDKRFIWRIVRDTPAVLCQGDAKRSLAFSPRFQNHIGEGSDRHCGLIPPAAVLPLLLENNSMAFASVCPVFCL